MSFLDPKERSERGQMLRARLTGQPTNPPATPYQAAVRDFVYAEVWTRDGLDSRARFLISLAGAACTANAEECVRQARGALEGKHIDLSELREAALHVAVYCGWSAGGLLDQAISAVAAELGLAEGAFDPIRAKPWDPEERHAVGIAAFLDVMKFDGPPPQTAYFEAGILNFVFGEMWTRPGLDQRSRRWLTLVGVGFSSATTPIRSHVWSAMASGNASREEMLEFVLQYALYAGWPRGSVMQSAVLEQAPRVEKGLPFEA